MKINIMETVLCTNKSQNMQFPNYIRYKKLVKVDTGKYDKLENGPKEEEEREEKPHFQSSSKTDYELKHTVVNTSHNIYIFNANYYVIHLVQN